MLLDKNIKLQHHKLLENNTCLFDYGIINDKLHLALKFIN